jgi:hypothetical protein
MITSSVLIMRRSAKIHTSVVSVSIPVSFTGSGLAEQLDRPFYHQQQYRRFSSTTSINNKFDVDHDPSEIKKKFRKVLEEERQLAILGGGTARIQKQHTRGSLTARERLELLFDTNTFHELDQLKSHRCTEFEMNNKKFPGDGIGTCVLFLYFSPFISLLSKTIPHSTSYLQ